MSRVKFVSVLSQDNLLLPGLLYSPVQPTKKAAIWIHGMGDNGIFYNPLRINSLAQSLNDKNITLLAFNNRGAHGSKMLRIIDNTLPEHKRTYQGGTYYEKIVDCTLDINGAINFLKDQGYSSLYLIGHSTGANKICVYHAKAKENPISKYVLAGPGDDSGLFYDKLGKARFWQALTYAKRMLARSKPLHLLPRYTDMYPFSAQSAYDILDPDGDYNCFPYFEATYNRLGHKQLFREYRTLDRPTLVIFGEQDEWTSLFGGSSVVLNILKRYLPKSINSNSAFVQIANTDHGFHDAEKEFSQKVASWLAS